MNHASLLVVPLSPLCSQIARFIERGEDPGVGDFVPIAEIAALDVGVLIRLACPNEDGADAVALASDAYDLRLELRPSSHRIRFAWVTSSVLARESLAGSTLRDGGTA